MVRIFVGILLIVACVAGAIGLLIGIVCAAFTPWGSLRSLVGDDFPIMVIIDSNPTWLIWSATVSILVFLFVTLYLLAHFTLRILGSVRPLSTKLRVTSLVVWLIALLFGTASLTNIASNCLSYHRYKKRHLEKNEDILKNEKDEQLNDLKNAGWVVTKDKNIRNYLNKGEHFSGNNSMNYLDAGMYHNGLGMEYEAIRTQKVAPGSYRLEAKGRADGEGAEIFVVAGDDRRIYAPIPVCGSRGGSVWNDARLALEADTAKILPNRSHLNSIAKANDSKGFGWSDVVIEDVIVGPDSILCYGVTNVSPTQTWDGTWLSATSFELKRKEQTHQ